MSLLTNPEKVLTTRLLTAGAPLDSKTVYPTLVARDAIPLIQRYHMMKVAVQDSGKEYRLVSAGDLTNTGWEEITVSGINEAPIDGSAYNRKDANWIPNVATELHDYKIWYIDFNSGLDTNDGGFDAPVLTMQKAIDLREADGATHAEIHILTDGFGSAATFSGPWTDTTTIVGLNEGVTGLNDLTINNSRVYFKHLNVRFNVVQTTGSNVDIKFFHCNVVFNAGSTADSDAAVNIWLEASSITLSRSLPYKLVARTASYVFCSNVTSTHTELQIQEGSTLDVVFATTITTLTTDNAFINTTVTLNVVDFNDVATVFSFIGSGTLNVTGTRISTTGEFALGASPHDYKTWYVDFNNGLDTNDGSFNLPVKTIQKAIDLREADGALFAQIKLGSDGGNQPMAGETCNFSTLSLTTRVVGNIRQFNTLQEVSVTDSTLYFDNVDISGLSLIQTGTNNLFVNLYNGLASDGNLTSLNDPAKASLALNGNVRFSVNLDAPYNITATNSNFIFLNGAATTKRSVSAFNNSAIWVQADMTVTDMQIEQSALRITAGNVLTIVDLIDNGVLFDTLGATLTVTGTRTSRSAEFANKGVNRLTDVIDGATPSLDCQLSGLTKVFWSTAQSAATLSLSNLGEELLIAVKKTIAGDSTITIDGTGLKFIDMNTKTLPATSVVVVLSDADEFYFEISLSDSGTTDGGDRVILVLAK